MEGVRKNPYCRTRAIRADHILGHDYPSIFKRDITKLRIIRIAPQSNYLHRSMDDDTGPGQLLLEYMLSNVLSEEEDVWVSSV